MTAKTRAAVAELMREDGVRCIAYHHWTIVEYNGRFQVRWFQEDLRIWHTWSPWAQSLEEAEHICEKLDARAEAGGDN
jgi:hypothetical protein